MKIINVALCLLLPAVALAEHDCERTLQTCPVVNEVELEAAIKAQAPDASLFWQACIGDRSVGGVIQPGTATPAYIRVHNVPDDVTCTQVWTFLQNHNPTEGMGERAERLDKEKWDNRIKQLPTIQDLIARIEALEAAP